MAIYPMFTCECEDYDDCDFKDSFLVYFDNDACLNSSNINK